MPFDEDDLFGEFDDSTSEVVAEAGFPVFAHNQWTIEGEIERMGAFGLAGARATGWKRTVAVVMVIVFLAPIELWVLTTLWSLVV